MGETSKNNVDMETAQDICEDYGGYLVEIDSEEESNELQKFYETNVQDHCMYEADSFWIGIRNETRKGRNGAWVSARTGEPLSYTNWYDNEPNNFDGNEQCASIWADTHQANDFGAKNFRWNDFDCSKTELSYFKKYNINMKALCERDVDPSEVVAEQVEAIQSIGEDGCLEGWTKLSTGCYLFKRQPSTFREARDICDKAGGHVVEIDSEDEYSAWNEGEPGNHGGGVPGEDCAIANLGLLTGEDSFTWYDVTCSIRGFPTDQGRGISFNPLCEQDQRGGQKTCEGCDQEWVKVGIEKYKFIKTSDGTTRDEAEQVCKDNGGRLADIRSEEERKALKQYYEENVKEKSNFFLSALNLITGDEERVQYGWWIGLTDELEEGSWQWKHSGQNMTYSAWFKVQHNPTNDNLFGYGGADCVAFAEKRDFLDADLEEEDGETWRDDFEKDGDFKWFSLSCYIKVLPLINVRMSPVCKM